jgi:hypothetical protein
MFPASALLEQWSRNSNLFYSKNEFKLSALVLRLLHIVNYQKLGVRRTGLKIIQNLYTVIQWVRGKSDYFPVVFG